MSSGTSSGSARGFASMGADKQREIARKGGKAAHAKGTAHEFTSDEARAAGKKGGESVSSNREHMSRIGRLGGKRSASRRHSVVLGGSGNQEQNSNGNESNGGEQASAEEAGNSPEEGTQS